MVRKEILAQKILTYVTSNSKNATVKLVLVTDCIVDDHDPDPHTGYKGNDDGDNGAGKETS